MTSKPDPSKRQVELRFRLTLAGLSNLERLAIRDSTHTNEKLGEMIEIYVGLRKQMDKGRKIMIYDPQTEKYAELKLPTRKDTDLTP